jgi:hypothetical protein
VIFWGVRKNQMTLGIKFRSSSYVVFMTLRADHWKSDFSLHGIFFGRLLVLDYFFGILKIFFIAFRFTRIFFFCFPLRELFSSSPHHFSNGPALNSLSKFSWIWCMRFMKSSTFELVLSFS